VLLKNDGGVLPLKKTQKVYVAGSNADDIGNQTGGWTITWQGQSGTHTTGTTILDGIDAAAPGLSVTYSKTASADPSGYDAGLVVVGETPYAEGQGDVGNNGHTLNLTAADKKAVDTVCAAIPTCVVLVVSGRPMMLGGVQDEAGAIVAGFLPGTEGEGVANVLLGDTPFTGRLPLSWPKSVDQLPLNVGDASYDPAWAYGWGLRTDAPRARLSTLVGSLSGEPKKAVQALLDAKVWKADGTLSDTDAGLRLVAAAAKTLTQATKAQVDAYGIDEAQQHPIDPAVLAQADTVVSLARDLAQQAVGQGSTPDAAAVTATADAEHLQEAGDAYDAAVALAKVAGVDVATPPLKAAPKALLPPLAVGLPVVGLPYVATPGLWSVPGVKITYQWNADGKPITGATKAVYTPTAADVGKRLTVTVTATKAGYHDGTATSPSTGKVIKLGR
jgi:beta-glucosidase